DIEALQAGYFTEEHKRFLTLVASRVAVAIENARLHTRLSRSARKLTGRNEISRELTSILNLDTLLQRIAELLTRVIDYQMFSVLLLDSTKTKLEHRFSVRFRQNEQIKNIVPVGSGLVGYAVEHKTAVVVPDVSKDQRYSELNPENRFEMAMPPIYKDETLC